MCCCLASVNTLHFTHDVKMFFKKKASNDKQIKSISAPNSNIQHLLEQTQNCEHEADASDAKMPKNWPNYRRNNYSAYL